MCPLAEAGGLSRKYIRHQLPIIFSIFSIVCFVLNSVLIQNPGGPPFGPCTCSAIVLGFFFAIFARI